MKPTFRRAVVAAVLLVSVPLALAACSTTPAVAPITKSIGGLQGETVKVPLNSMLNLNTGSLATDSYSAKIADPSIASFVKGKKDGSATFNPGLEPLKTGTTDVTLSNSDGGIEDVTFTLEVTRSRK